VKGVLCRLNGEAPFFERVLNMLRARIPSYWWGVDVLPSNLYVLPSSRERVLLRGLHKIFCPTGLPPCLPAFGEAQLRNFIAHDLPNIAASALTPPQQANLCWYMTQIANDLANGKAKGDDLCILTLDRSPGMVYKPNYSFNVVPTLTTNNRYLFLCIAGECAMADQDRTLHRFLTPSERFGIQGKDPQMAALLPSRVVGVKASGNSYPTPIILAGLAPLLQAIADTGGPFHFSIYNCIPPPL
jgi:hypothetical protein